MMQAILPAMLGVNADRIVCATHAAQVGDPLTELRMTLLVGFLRSEKLRTIAA